VSNNYGSVYITCAFEIGSMKIYCSWSMIGLYYCTLSIPRHIDANNGLYMFFRKPEKVGYSWKWGGNSTSNKNQRNLMFFPTIQSQSTKRNAFRWDFLWEKSPERRRNTWMTQEGGYQDDTGPTCQCHLTHEFWPYL